ncbi:GNAT family N-acetyltransferase [Catenuloplanes indicus]|uniref:GNAT superfamily N-acetyltransferase n=1 Tax=Catenuloplanes indicus TaxID=137267 RepID=A0AAE3VU94_9ACTN|nr:GNAT family N-acetyltransferase [Catenuloplanes indicus]MDQ0363770.1 GNAT superfamily N-acetyltransferase [Catenuloplanes indicus]
MTASVRYRLRPATEADLDRLLAVLNGAVTWLRQRGVDQWGGEPWHAAELRPGLKAGALYLAESREAVPVATMTLDDVADEDFWSPEDDLSAALYLRHLAVDRALSGRGIGSWMLGQAARHAARRGKEWLRLDASKTNTRLHAYYRQQGFQQLRTVHVPNRASGARFQRCAASRPASAARPICPECRPGTGYARR